MVGKEGKITDATEQLFACAELPPLIQVLTRIRPDDLEGKPKFVECLERLQSLIPAEAVVIGQNIQFDLGMLKGEGMDLTAHPTLDTAMLASLVFPELESFSLPYLSKVLHLNHAPAHRAMGDVRATLELFTRCYERLQGMTGPDRDVLLATLQKGPRGFQLLGEALAREASTSAAFSIRDVGGSQSDGNSDRGSAAIVPSQNRKVTLIDEPLDERLLARLLRQALEQTEQKTFIAVKNLRIALEHLPKDLRQAIAANHIGVLYPPQALLDHTAQARLLEQSEYSNDEVTLALKLQWTKATTRYDIALHGNEDSVWNGTLRSVQTAPEYLAQFTSSARVFIVEHRELLQILAEPSHPGLGVLAGDTSIIIDDASMLEDTATRAFGWFCATDDLRAASSTNPVLGKFVDTLQLWVEQTRGGQDIRYITLPDVERLEAKGLREQISNLRQTELTNQTQRSLEHLEWILTPANLKDRICYIEITRNGNQLLHSVPLRMGELLWNHLFTAYHTSLLIPAGSQDMLPEILPGAVAAELSQLSGDTSDLLRQLPLNFPTDVALDTLIQEPPAGKTVVLLPGRQTIENMYIKYAEQLESRGITMICQGLNGGLGRMQGEFHSAEGTVIWLLTPWMFEGVDLPSNTVDHLYINTLPFDYPSHPVLSERSKCYGDAFSDYSLPRLLHRLFRLLRTFARIRTANGNVKIVDDRLFSKKYGERVRKYLSQFGTSEEVVAPPPRAKKPAPKADMGTQPPLF